MNCESRKFQAEQLEERVLLAGNVALGIIVAGGSADVSLTGDADSNALAISTDGGELTVEGLDGTRLTPGAFNIPPFVLANLISDTDFDGVSASYVTFNAAFVNALAGNTPLDANAVIALGDGDDFALVDGTTIGNNVGVFLGSGNDAFVMADSNVGGDLFVDAGAGNDAVVLVDSSFAGDVDVRMGDGDDLLHATYNVFGDTTGPFEDLIFSMDAGDDLLEYGGNVFYNTGVVVVDGGAGHDRQDWVHGTPDDQYVNTAPSLPNWEHFDPADDSPTGVAV